MAVSAGTVYVDVKPNTATLGSDLTKQSKGIFSKVSANLGKILAGAFVGKQIFDFGADIIHAAEEAQAETKKSFSLIRSDADKTGISLTGLTSWAEDFGDRIGQDDEAIVTLASKLTQAIDLSKLFGEGNEGDGLTTLTQGILDFSAATGKAQTMSTKLFQSIANDPASATTTLLKLGVITEQQADHYKHMAEAGRGAQASQELLGAVTNKYQGAAEKGATASAKLSVVWDNLKETLGNFLLPLFQQFMSWLGKLVVGFQEWLKNGHSMEGGLATLGAVVETLWSAIQTLVGWGAKLVSFLMSSNPLAGTLRTIIIALTAAFIAYSAAVSILSAATKIATAVQAIFNGTLALNPIGLVIAAVVLLGVIIVKNWSTIKKVTLAVWGAITRVWHSFVEGLKVVGNFIVGAIKLYIGLWVGLGKAIVRVVLGIVHFVTSKFMGIVHFFSSLPGKLANAGSAMWDWLIDAAKGVVNDVIGLFNTMIGFVNKFQIHIHFDPPGPGPQVNFDWNGPGIPLIPTLASGGIVTQPTLALIGEAGPEAVVPLDRLGGLGGPMSVEIVDSNLGVVMRGVLRTQASHDQRARRMTR